MEKKYPLLDETLRANLKESGIAGLYVTKVNVKVPRDTSEASLHCAIPCATSSRYSGFVNYSYTICTSPDFKVDDKVRSVARETHQDSTLAMISEKNPVTHMIKDDERFKSSVLLCRTVTGSWSAYLDDRELCGYCSTMHEFTLSVPGLDFNLIWHWFGSVSDFPVDAPRFTLPQVMSVTKVDCDPTDATPCQFGAPQ